MRLMTENCPLWQAMWRGVSPSAFFICKSQPWRSPIKYVITSEETSASNKLCNGVLPWWSTILFTGVLLNEWVTSVHCSVWNYFTRTTAHSLERTRCSGVSPWLFLASTSTRWTITSEYTMSLKLFFVARWRGVFPSSSLMYINFNNLFNRHLRDLRIGAQFDQQVHQFQSLLLSYFLLFIWINRYYRRFTYGQQEIREVLLNSCECTHDEDYLI